MHHLLVVDMSKGLKLEVLMRIDMSQMRAFLEQLLLDSPLINQLCGSKHYL